MLLKKTLDKSLRSFAFVFTIIALLASDGEAHWYQTHQYMIDLACDTYVHDGKSQNCDFLHNVDKGRTYLDLLKQGAYDADLRVNGIYAVDFHCEDLSKSSCSEKVSNDIPEIVVGDHGYNSETGKGFHSLPAAISRVDTDWPGWADSNNQIGQKLLAVLKGKTPEKKKKALLSLMKKATAADLATFFYNRALIEWENNHPGDAFYNLGIALHAVQDLTVPHHSNLITDNRHGLYEQYVGETYLPAIKQNPLVIPGNYLKARPADWVKLAANESFNWNLDDPSDSASESVALGVALSAGFITNFLNDAQIDVAMPVLNDPFLKETVTLNNLASGLTFDDFDNLYISTVGGEVFKLDGNKLSTFIAEGVGGFDFDNHIRTSQGNLYVHNTQGVGTGGDHVDEVVLFNSSGAFIRRLLVETDIGASFFSDIAVNAQAQLYVATSTSSDDIVVRIDANKKNRTTIIRKGVGGVFVPTSLAVDKQGNLYVGTPSVVSKFDGNGNFLKEIAQDGVNGFYFANNIAVDRNNNLYIGNLILGYGSNQSIWNVLRFDSDGNFLEEFVEAGAAGLSAFPDDMGFDIQGRLYIVDILGVDGIARFDQLGNFDRIGVKNYDWAGSSSIRVSEKSARMEEIERHFRDLAEKDRGLRMNMQRGLSSFD